MEFRFLQSSIRCTQAVHTGIIFHVMNNLGAENRKIEERSRLFYPISINNLTHISTQDALYVSLK